MLSIVITQLLMMDGRLLILVHLLLSGLVVNGSWVVEFFNGSRLSWMQRCVYPPLHHIAQLVSTLDRRRIAQVSTSESEAATHHCRSEEHRQHGQARGWHRTLLAAVLSGISDVAGHKKSFVLVISRSYGSISGIQNINCV